MPVTSASSKVDARPGNPQPSAAPGAEPRFLFSSHYSGLGPSTAQASLERFLASAAVHLLGLLAVVGLIRFTPAGRMISSPMESIPFHEIVWLNKPGPGGGGGGGGNRMPFAPKKANAEIPIAKQRPAFPVPTAKPTEAPPPALELPARPNDVAMVLPGAIDVAGDALARGPGSGGGYGTGSGTGIGPGTGPGLGPGSGGGTGGGAYHPGSGVTPPEIIKEVKPLYTADGMRARIQGEVQVRCVVQPDGSVTDLMIVKSLDPVYGLDQEALKAAAQWRFRPGRLKGQPVPVIVDIVLSFRIY